MSGFLPSIFFVVLVSCRRCYLVRCFIRTSEMDFKNRTEQVLWGWIVDRRICQINLFSHDFRGVSSTVEEVHLNQNKYPNLNSQSDCRSWDRSLCSFSHTFHAHTGRKYIASSPLGSLPIELALAASHQIQPSALLQVF